MQEEPTQKIVPYLWFDTQAEETVNFYTSLFKNSRILEVTRYGGPYFKFSEAISLFVNCADQAEVDDLWAKFTEGGDESMCGWLKDKYGLSWQIIPAGLTDFLNRPDPVKSARAVLCMFTMKKIDLAKIQQAYEQG
jgi:predicted 3-demethylubiquinone-9 3-methyltransferase (glyoxalase superfamily)